MLSKPNIISSVSYRHSYDPVTEALVAMRAKQTVFIDGLTTGTGAKAVEQAKAAVLAANSAGELDNPSVEGMILGDVDGRLTEDGAAAFVYVTWFNPRLGNFSGGQPRVMAHSSDFPHTTDRYLYVDSAVAIATHGQKIMRDPEGRPAKVVVPVPATSITRYEFTNTLPADIMVNVGTFTTIIGVADLVRIHPPEVTFYGGNTATHYRIARIYEWRKPGVSVSTGAGSQIINGWGEQTIDKDDQVSETGPTGAPMG